MLSRTVFTLLLIVICQSCLADPLRILLTNDDGYKAPGIRAMYKALIHAGHDVTIVAPATQQSGSAASITSGGVSINEAEPGIWSVDGRPADAVRVGIGHIMKDNPPDLVISGANFGQNVGYDTNVSGTVGAAITALQLGFRAIAISVEVKFTDS
ncbi:MAG: 5'/3'-nucleotidase SurE, partial [Pseudomonadales bacterium]|nr:5'/3'-nucleotidase SurE [Pseudomonadales bacterium]